MTKADLKSGMVVETRDGARYLVVAESKDLIGEEYHMEYTSHNDDLTYSNKLLDIVKVYKPWRNIFSNMLENPGKPIWERPEHYNGKVVCIKGIFDLTTKGKIYQFVEGVLTFDNGNKSTTHCRNFEDVCKNFMSKFIEVVE